MEQQLKTIYDLVAIGLFAGLAILFLQRSASQAPDPIPMWKYGVPAVGCAVADYLGNHDQAVLAIVLFVAVCAFSIMMLRPFHQGPTA
jgi:hypothetical protein